MKAHLLQGTRDPLKAAQTRTSEDMLKEVAKLLHGAGIHNVLDVAGSLLVTGVRQAYATRREAEAAWDERVAKLKGLLLEQHYDSVTGKRKSALFPFNQKITFGAPFKAK